MINDLLTPFLPIDKVFMLSSHFEMRVGASPVFDRVVSGVRESKGGSLRLFKLLHGAAPEWRLYLPSAESAAAAGFQQCGGDVPETV